MIIYACPKVEADLAILCLQRKLATVIAASIC